jgi:hypothetical protein
VSAVTRPDNNYMTAEKKPTFKEVADAIADAHDADVLFVNAPIFRPLDANLLELCRHRRRRKNIILLLVTQGGDADAAYRIARCLQTSYERFILFLTGYCKSAGTLVAIGAHAMIVADSGELGPLDVQMSKPDELLQRQSGLTATAALSTLHEQAFQAFEHFFLTLVRKSRNAISTRTATQLAVQLTGELFKPVYGQVDPMHVGEAGRAMQVAEQYGQILQNGSSNLVSGALATLTTGFASHEFVIDRAQIQTLFKNVRPPDAMEQALVDVLGPSAVDPAQPGPLMAYLSSEQSQPQEQSLPLEMGNSDDQNPVEPEQSNAHPIESGAASAGEPQASTETHVATIRPVRTPGRSRNSRAS